MSPELTFVIILVIPVLSVLATMWLLSRRQFHLAVTVRVVPDDGEDPDEDELDTEVVSIEHPKESDVARFN